MPGAQVADELEFKTNLYFSYFSKLKIRARFKLEVLCLTTPMSLKQHFPRRTSVPVKISKFYGQ